MLPIEAAIVETLRRTGSCCLDDVVMSLPNSSWGEVFAAVDRMSRDGRVLLHQRSSAYQVTLTEVAQDVSTVELDLHRPDPSQFGWRSGTETSDEATNTQNSPANLR